MEQHLIHSTATLNGSGTVQSRTDIVRSRKIILNDTDSLSSQLVNANYEYIIVYNFDLDSASITIPNNCVLNFQGGSISNGTITLQNTRLEGDIKWSGVTISGSCSNDLLTPQMFGAYPALTETESNKTQNTLGFENLVRVVGNQNTIGKTIYISSGHYAINKRIYFTTSCKFYGDGDISVIDLYDGTGTIMFGEISRYSNNVHQVLNTTITADVSKFDRKISVTSTEGLNPGDFLILCDTKDGSFNNSRIYYRTCECIKIKSINNNDIYIDDILYGDYFANFGEDYSTTFDPAPSNRTVISKFNPYTFNISDFKVLSHAHNDEAPSREYYSFLVRAFYNSTFKNITIENYGNDVAASISLGLNFQIDHCIFRSFTTYTTDAYGLALAMSQNFKVSHTTFRANSHALTTGQNSSYFAIQNRNFIYDNLNFETSEKINYNLDDDYTFIDLDIHAAAEYYKIINTIAPQTTCDTGGYNVTIEGCKFYTITPTFNMGDYIINHCELFGQVNNMLFSNNNRENENGKNSIVIENCTFHKYVGLNFQDQYFTRPFEYLTIRNNTFHNSLHIRRGYFKQITIENNYSSYGYIGSNGGDLKADTVSIKNNVLQDGYMYWGFSQKIVEGIISNNTIIEVTPRPERDNGYILAVTYFKGNICQNMIISYPEFNKNDSSASLVFLSSNCDVSFFDNILKKGRGTISSAIIRNQDYSNLIFKRNVHNSLRRTCIDDSVSGNAGLSTSTSDKYTTLQSNDLAKTKVDFFNIGDFIYERTTNKQLYLSNKSQGTTLAFMALCNNSGSTGCFPGQAGCIANNLTYGESYCCWINNSGSDDYNLYFSKYEMNDQSFSTDELYICLEQMTTKAYYCFTAPDPSVYPYIYCTTTSNSAHSFFITKNSKICEYDGAVYNVARRGTTAQRPGYYEIYQGFKYWDTDLKKEIIAEEINSSIIYWRESDGIIAGTKRIGTTSERPTGLYKPNSTQSNWRSNIYIGFRYYDTDLGQELYASAISVDGTVTWSEMIDVGAYTGSIQSSASANYISEPEVKTVTINGSSTNAASSNNCQLQYDTTNECLKFVFN